MKLKLKRTFFADKYTIGKLYIDDVYFCDTLEDTNRDLNKNGKFDGNETKVYGSTCIPFGVYTVLLTLSAKFKRELPLLVGVPNYDGVRIHRGNVPADTLGCILVGENKVKGQVINSATKEIRLVSIMREAVSRKEPITIEIV